MNWQTWLEELNLSPEVHALAHSFMQRTETFCQALNVSADLQQVVAVAASIAEHIINGSDPE